MLGAERLAQASYETASTARKRKSPLVYRLFSVMISTAVTTIGIIATTQIRPALSAVLRRRRASARISGGVRPVYRGSLAP